jgi:hypothetical protein
MTTLFNLDWLKRTNKRQLAYRTCFLHEGQLTQDASLVLKDLAEFCYLGEPTITLDNSGRVDSHAAAVKEGRREAFLHLAKMLDRGTFAELQKRLAEMEQQETY